MIWTYLIHLHTRYIHIDFLFIPRSVKLFGWWCAYLARGVIVIQIGSYVRDPYSAYRSWSIFDLETKFDHYGLHINMINLP